MSVASGDTFRTFRFLAVRCGVAVVALGLFGLLSGLTALAPGGLGFRASVPMALSTATIFLLFGAYLLLPGPTPGRRAGPFSQIVLAGLTLLASLEVADYFFDCEIGLLDIAGMRLQMRLGILPQPMSPVTSGLLALAGVALWLGRLAPAGEEESSGRNSAAGLLGVGVLAPGLVLLLAYLYGTPLFYGGSMVPVALPTAAAFLFLGVGVVCLAGPAGAPLRSFLGASLQARLLRVFIPPMVLLSLANPILNMLLLHFFPMNIALMAGVWGVTYAGATAWIVLVMGKVLGREMACAGAERRLTEEALVRSESRQRILINTIPDLVWLKDPQGLYLMCNLAFERFFGAKEATILGKSDYDFVDKELADFFRAHDRKAMEAGTSLANEEWLTFAWGGYHGLFETIKTPLRDESGAVVGVLGISRDITERRRMQEAMVQTEKMMSVGGLAAGMAHEINNPLGGILQNVQVLQRRLSETSPVNEVAAQEAGCSFGAVTAFMQARQVLSFLAAIRESGERAAQVVRSMLDFVRSAESRNAPVNISALLDNTLQLCATDYDLKKKYDFRAISIRRDYAPDLPEVLCSKTQIQQVFMNLLANAAQAMRGVGAPLISVRTALEGDMVRVEIKDNGPGMEETVRRKVFEPFFTTKPVGEGTGLGLSVSYFIITNNHHGAIEVESAPGQGARFIIRLPVNRPEE